MSNTNLTREDRAWAKVAADYCQRLERYPKLRRPNKMKRYKIDCMEYPTEPCIDEDPNGEWVRYEDAARALHFADHQLDEAEYRSEDWSLHERMRQERDEAQAQVAALREALEASEHCRDTALWTLRDKIESKPRCGSQQILAMIEQMEPREGDRADSVLDDTEAAAAAHDAAVRRAALEEAANTAALLLPEGAKDRDINLCLRVRDAILALAEKEGNNAR